jgi:hypothetical protein
MLLVKRREGVTRCGCAGNWEVWICCVTHGKFAAANSVVLHQLSNVCIRGSGEERIHHRHVNNSDVF